MDILMIKLGALGDVVNTLPLAVRLKNQFGARIHWVAESLSFPLLDRHECVDSVILFDRARWKESLPGVLKAIRGRRYDVSLDLQRIAKSAFLCMVSSAQRRIGFDRRRCKEMTWLMPFERIHPRDPSSHMVSQYLEFAEHLGASSGGIEWLIPAGDAPAVPLPGSYIVLNIGATKPANRWNVHGFAGLAGLVHERFGAACVLTGGKEDRVMADGIVSSARCPVIDLVGRTTIMELVSVLSGAQAVVTCDTGPMHLAVALGKEVLALFGPADPRRTGPYRGHVIKKNLPCSPCNKKTCSEPMCMDAILPEEVAGELELILK